MSISHQDLCMEIERRLREEHASLRERFYSGDVSIKGRVIDEGSGSSYETKLEDDPSSLQAAAEVTIVETLECFARLMKDDKDITWEEFCRIPSPNSPLRLAWDHPGEMHDELSRGGVAFMREMVITVATYWRMLYEAGSAFILRRAAWFDQYGPEMMRDAMIEVYSGYDDRMATGVLDGFIQILFDSYHIDPGIMAHKGESGMSMFFDSAIDPSNNIALTMRNLGIRLETYLFSIRMHNCLLLENMMHMPIAVGTFVMLAQRLLLIVEYWRNIITSDVVMNAESLVDSIGLGERDFSDSYLKALIASNVVIKNKIMEVINEA